MLTRHATHRAAPQEVEGHFSMFKEFDLDDSGFISPDNLMSIMEVTAARHNNSNPNPNPNPNPTSCRSWRQLPAATRAQDAPVDTSADMG